MKNILLSGFLGSLMLLAACGTSTTTNTTTLAQVQAEAASIDAGIDAANVIAQASTTLTAAQKALAEQATVAADSAAAVVAKVQTGGTVTADLTAFDTAVEGVMPTLDAVFAVNPATAAAINLGLGLKDAFMAGLTASVTLSHPMTYGATLKTNAPVPVPLPTHTV